MRSQRILRLLHWMHESAGRLRRRGSVGVAGEDADAGADGGADPGADAGVDAKAVVSMSTSMAGV